MKYLHSWLKDYIDGDLPKRDELARVVSLKSLEVEGIEIIGDDAVYDVKVLPHRSSDVMSHRGLAREIAALFALKRKEVNMPPATSDSSLSVRVEVLDHKLCPRYIGVRVDGISVLPAPAWIV